jgi:hypothetical protein
MSKLRFARAALFVIVFVLDCLPIAVMAVWLINLPMNSPALVAT